MTILDSTATDGLVSLVAIRRVASEWHGGQASPLYALTSSGAIVPGCLGEISACISSAEDHVAKATNDPGRAEWRREVIRLRQLRQWVGTTGYRDAVPGWDRLTW